MPNKLPVKPRAKLARAEDGHQPIDWLALWAISLGICAVVLAATAFFCAADKIGAVMVLVGTATLIVLILEGSARGYL
ncbi:MAG TPA: hypothetical protein VFB31_00870 [Pseudolabrys sp.]|nr:hypothetical protein [Pseudolabrys sp.]